MTPAEVREIMDSVESVLSESTTSGHPTEVTITDLRIAVRAMAEVIRARLGAETGEA